MPALRTDAFVKTVESLLSEKQAVAERETELVSSLNRVLTEMGYEVVPRRSGRATGRRRRERRPGRPAVIVAEPLSTSPPAPELLKRRGRRPKATAPGTAMPRRRGRPPKALEAPVTPKRRGRPPETEGAGAAPKRRGRPPKAS